MDRSEAGKLGYKKTGETLKALAQERSDRVRQAYASNPKFCLQCGLILPFEKRRSSFCNQSCAASYRNRNVTRHFKHSNICACGNKKKRHNKWCNECIAKQVYNRPQTFSEIRDQVARKRFLIEQRGHHCESCGLAEWLEKLISLELHHVDGDADNNSEENLKLLCPNCHAQTEHYKGAVKGKNSSRQIRRRKRYAEGKSW